MLVSSCSILLCSSRWFSTVGEQEGFFTLQTQPIRRTLKCVVVFTHSATCCGCLSNEVGAYKLFGAAHIVLLIGRLPIRSMYCMNRDFG